MDRSLGEGCVSTLSFVAGQAYPPTVADQIYGYGMVSSTSYITDDNRHAGSILSNARSSHADIFN